MKRAEKKHAEKEALRKERLIRKRQTELEVQVVMYVTLLWGARPGRRRVAGLWPPGDLRSPAMYLCLATEEAL